MRVDGHLCARSSEGSTLYRAPFRLYIKLTVKIKPPERCSRYAPILGGDLDERFAMAAGTLPTPVERD